MALFLPEGLSLQSSVADDAGTPLSSQIGSLSGGCVEEELVASIGEGGVFT